MQSQHIFSGLHAKGCRRLVETGQRGSQKFEGEQDMLALAARVRKGEGKFGNDGGASIRRTQGHGRVLELRCQRRLYALARVHRAHLYSAFHFHERS